MRNISNELNYENLINYLIKAGYEKGTGAQGQSGYIKIYHKNIYRMWVTFDLNSKRVWLYEEYDCGGCLRKSDYTFPDEILVDLDSFSNWWDNTIADKLDGYE